MRRIMIIVSAALALGLVVSCGDDNKSGDGDDAAKATVYFGWLLGAEDIAAVALEIQPAGEDGMSEVRAYLCDGRGEPEGKAIWFLDSVDVDATQSREGNATLTSAGGQEDLVLEFVSSGRVQGAFKDASGKRTQFMAYPAIDGAGIYEVTLDENLEYTGTSTDGNTLTATAEDTGLTSGTIETSRGETVEFSVQSLSLATPAQLDERGLATDYGKFAKVNQVPGEYVAVIAPGGSHWLGRSANVRGGSPGANIIGLDKKC